VPDILLIASIIVITTTRFILLYLLVYNVTCYFSTDRKILVNATALTGCLFALTMGWLTS